MKKFLRIVGYIFTCLLLLLLVGPFLVPIPPLEHTVTAHSLAE